MQVVEVGVLTEDQPQVLLTGDQYPVQALAAGTGNPPLAIAFARRLSGRLDDPDTAVARTERTPQ